MKRAILGILVGLALGALGFFIAASQVDQPPGIDKIWPIALAVVATLLAWLLQGIIIALLSLPGLGSFRPLEMTRVYLATQAAGGITPFSGGEIPYQLLELDRTGLSSEDAGAVITLRSIMNGVVLIIGAMVGLFFIPRLPFVGNIHLSLSSRKFLWGAAIAIAVAGLVFAAFVAYRRSSRTGRESGNEPRWLEKVLAKVSEYAHRLRNYFRHLKESLIRIWQQEPWVVIGCFGVMILYWLVYPFLGTLALRAAGWDGTGWFHVFLAQYVLFLVIPLAPTPGNSGAAELAFVALMGAYVPHGALLGGVIIWRTLNHYSEIVVGGFIAGRNLPENIKAAKREFGSESD